jgi:hypothetical protein
MLLLSPERRRWHHISTGFLHKKCCVWSVESLQIEVYVKLEESLIWIICVNML